WRSSIACSIPSRGLPVAGFGDQHRRAGTPRLSNIGIDSFDMPHWSRLLAVALVSATLLMIELALTRIFSVVMYYHFAFLAISIALFGLSASGVFTYLRAPVLDGVPT